MTRVAVCSRSFSKNDRLRHEVLKEYPDSYFNETGKSFSGQELIDFLQGADLAITALEVFNTDVISKLDSLKAIGKYGVGLDMLDLHALEDKGIKLGWTAGVNKRSVSELVISLMISCLRSIAIGNKEIRDGIWRQTIGRQLSNQTIGIIGCGNVGKDLVPLLQAFGCNILVHDIRDYPDFYDKYSIRSVSLERLLSQSDIITLHVPKNETTVNMLSKDRLLGMKKKSILINAARGGLVDENALYSCLESGHISSAAFDVFEEEPACNNPLVSLKNFVATPHIGGSAEEAILAMGRAAIKGLSNSRSPLDYISHL